GPRPGPPPAPTPVPRPRPAVETAPALGRISDRTTAATLEMVLDSPGTFEGKAVSIERLYKIGTLLKSLKGSDGREIGVSLPVAGDDDRPICKEDGKVAGRDRYLVLDSGLAPVLMRTYNEYHFRSASRPVHKTTLTVTVRPMLVHNASVPDVTITDLEIL